MCLLTSAFLSDNGYVCIVEVINIEKCIYIYIYIYVCVCVCVCVLLIVNPHVKFKIKTTDTPKEVLSSFFFT